MAERESEYNQTEGEANSDMQSQEDDQETVTEEESEVPIV